MPGKNNDVRLSNAEWLREQYEILRRSAPDMAAEIGVSKHTVLKALRDAHIEIRARTSKYWQLNDKEWLRRMYYDEQKSAREIARMLECAPGVVNSSLVSIGIKLRNSKEAMKVKYPDGRYGDKAARWQGGKIVIGGYVYLYAPDHPVATPDNPHVQEHRLVMEEVLGRYLEPDEVVHHKDGNKKNNRPDNLEVKSRSRHISEHFLASHEVLQLRQRVKELEAEVAYLKDKLKYMESGYVG